MTCQLIAQKHTELQGWTDRCHACGKLTASDPACLLSIEKIALQLTYKTAIWHMHKEYMMADHSEGIYLHE